MKSFPRLRSSKASSGGKQERPTLTSRKINILYQKSLRNCVGLSLGNPLERQTKTQKWQKFADYTTPDELKGAEVAYHEPNFNELTSKYSAILSASSSGPTGISAESSFHARSLKFAQEISRFEASPFTV